MIRNKTIAFNVSELEKKALEKASTSDNRSIASFARNILLSKALNKNETKNE